MRQNGILFNATKIERQETIKWFFDINRCLLANLYDTEFHSSLFEITSK